MIVDLPRWFRLLMTERRLVVVTSCQRVHRVSTESLSQLTVDSDSLPVLQDAVPSGHLHRHCIDPFPGEGARYASLQGDNWLLEETQKHRERQRAEWRQSQSLSVPLRNGYQQLVNMAAVYAAEVSASK